MSYFAGSIISNGFWNFSVCLWSNFNYMFSNRFVLAYVKRSTIDATGLGQNIFMQEYLEFCHIDADSSHRFEWYLINPFGTTYAFLYSVYLHLNIPTLHDKL